MSDTKQDRDNAIDLLEAQVDLLNSLTTILLRRSFNRAYPVNADTYYM